MKNLFDITGNVTVITGGTGVLGREIAGYLACNGAHVVIMGRNEEKGKKIVQDVEASNASGSIEFMHTDVLDREKVEHNCDDILKKYGRQDL